LACGLDAGHDASEPGKPSPPVPPPTTTTKVQTPSLKWNPTRGSLPIAALVCGTSSAGGALPTRSFCRISWSRTCAIPVGRASPRRYLNGRCTVQVSDEDPSMPIVAFRERWPVSTNTRRSLGQSGAVPPQLWR
jgi:hypothetical protein